MVVSKVGQFPVANREVLSGLRQLGFTDYEARIYVQLLKTSPATAYEIAKAAGVPRANTYAALEALAQRGAVLPVNEEPLRYIAAPPKSLFEAISGQTRALCDDLADRLSVMTAGRHRLSRVDDTRRHRRTGEDRVDDRGKPQLDLDQGGRRRGPAAQGVAQEGGGARRLAHDRAVRTGRWTNSASTRTAASTSMRATAPAWAPPTTCSPSRSTSRRC